MTNQAKLLKKRDTPSIAICSELALANVNLWLKMSLIAKFYIFIAIFYVKMSSVTRSLVWLQQLKKYLQNRESALISHLD